MKWLLVYLTFIVFSECIGQSPSPDDFIKSKQHPVWFFKPGFNNDSTIATNLELYKYDSLLIFFQDQIKPIWDYQLYILSAKTGKLIRQQTTKVSYLVTSDGVMLGIYDSLLARYNAYTGKIKWSIIADNIFPPAKSAKGKPRFLSNPHIQDSLIYICASPDGDASHSILLVINSHTGTFSKYKFNYGLNYAYGDTAFVEDDFLRGICLKDRKKLWKKEWGSPYDNNHPASIFYEKFYVSKNTILLYKYTIYDLDSGRIYGDKLYYYADSVFIALIDKKTGNELYKTFIKNSHDHKTQRLVNDTDAFYYFGDSLIAFDNKTLKKKWCVSNDELEKYKIELNNNDHAELKSDGKQVFVLDSNSGLICIDKNSGAVKWGKNFGHHIEFWENDFNLLGDFVVINMMDLHGDTAFNHHTEIIDKNNPDHTAKDGTIFQILLPDLKNSDVYIFDEETTRLMRIKYPE